MPVPLDDLLRHRAAIRQLAVRLTGADDADDVVQETYLRAVRQPPSGNALAWLSRVATNVVRFRGRSDARRRARETRVVENGPLEAPGADAVLLEMEATERVSQALRALAEPYRTTLVQRFWLGWSNAQIAAAAGIGEAAVRQRHKRALAMLRDALERGGPDRPALSRSQLGVAFGMPRAAPPSPPVPMPDPAPVAALPAAAASTLALTTTLMKTSTTIGMLALALGAAALLGVWSGIGSSSPATIPSDPAPVVRQSELVSDGEGSAQPTTGTPLVRTAAGGGAAPEAEVAADTAALRVRALFDDDGSAASGVILFVRPWRAEGAARADRTRAVTDADGWAMFDGLRPGELYVSGFFRSKVPAVIAVAAGAVADLELRIPRGTTVRGRVVDSAGRGIGGAQVLMTGWAGSWAVPIAVADDEGRFRLAAISASASVGANADGFLPSRLRHLTVGERSELGIEIVLEPAAATLRVRILGPDGEPVAGAKVAAGPLGRQTRPEMGASGAHEVVVPQLCVTDADGVAALGGVRAGALPIEVAATGLAGWIGEIDVRPTRRGPVEHELRLLPGIDAHGTVRDHAGVPIEGVFVEHGSHGHLVANSTQTDADGRYRLTDLPAGTAVMHAQKRGQDLRETVSTTPGRPVQWDPVFDEGQELRGIVRRSDGSAVEHVEVSAFSSQPPWHGYGSSRQDGTFTLRMPSAVDTVRVRVAWLGGFERLVHDGAVPTSPLEITLGPEFETTAAIRGHLVDAIGARVVNARIWYGLDGQGNSRAAELESDGSFSIEIAPGTYRLEVEANGYAILHTTTTVVADEQKDIGALRLEPPAAIRVELSAPEPVASEFDFWLTSRDDGRRQRLIVRDGVGELGGLRQGRYRLQVRGARLACQIHDVFLPARDEPTVVPITAARGLDLAFLVTLPAGAPRPRQPTLTVTDVRGRVVLDFRATLQADGRLYGDYALAPGTYAVALDADELRVERTVEVPANATEELRVELELRPR